MSHAHKLLTCLPLFPGRPVGPLFPEIPGSPFGPISPCATNQINVQFGRESCNFAEQIQNSLFECVSHFLSKHSWETHSTLWIK